MPELEDGVIEKVKKEKMLQRLTGKVNKDDDMLTDIVNGGDDMEIEKAEVGDSEIEIEKVDVDEFSEIEKIDVDLQLEEYDGAEADEVQKYDSAGVADTKFRIIFAVAVTAIVLSVAALVFSIAKTDLKIGQGELFVKSGVVNEMLGNLIRNDLAARAPDDVDIREINIQVVLYGGDAEDSERYSKVADIGDTDSISAEVVFFPQENIADFAHDCRAILDVMKEQAQEQGIVYEQISFVAKDALTSINAELSGRFSMDISVKEIAAISFYFGEIDN